MKIVSVSCLLLIAAAALAGCGSNADISSNANLVKNANINRAVDTPRPPMSTPISTPVTNSTMSVPPGNNKNGVDTGRGSNRSVPPFSRPLPLGTPLKKP